MKWVYHRSGEARLCENEKAAELLQSKDWEDTPAAFINKIEPVEEVAVPADYSTMTDDELKELAKGLGLKVHHKAKRETIINQIREALGK